VISKVNPYNGTEYSKSWTKTYDATNDVMNGVTVITNHATANALIVNSTETLTASAEYTLTLPAFITPSAFYLDKDNSMDWVISGGTRDQAGGVSIPAGWSNTWVTSGPSESAVVYESGDWTLLIHTPQDWASTPTVYFGEWDGSQINPDKKYGPFTLVGWDAANFTYTMQLTGVPRFTVEDGKYLALEITNNSSVTETVVTCNRVGGAWLQPPPNAPLWPLPETTTALLLGLGLAGLVGLVAIKKKSAVKAG